MMEYEYKVYGQPEVYLAEGWYTLKDLQRMIAHLAKLKNINKKHLTRDNNRRK